MAGFFDTLNDIYTNPTFVAGMSMASGTDPAKAIYNAQLPEFKRAEQNTQRLRTELMQQNAQAQRAQFAQDLAYRQQVAEANQAHQAGTLGLSEDRLAWDQQKYRQEQARLAADRAQFNALMPGGGGMSAPPQQPFSLTPGAAGQAPSLPNAAGAQGIPDASVPVMGPSRAAPRAAPPVPQAPAAEFTPMAGLDSENMVARAAQGLPAVPMSMPVSGYNESAFNTVRPNPPGLPGIQPDVSQRQMGVNAPPASMTSLAAAPGGVPPVAQPRAMPPAAPGASVPVVRPMGGPQPGPMAQAAVEAPPVPAVDNPAQSAAMQADAAVREQRVEQGVAGAAQQRRADTPGVGRAYNQDDFVPGTPPWLVNFMNNAHKFMGSSDPRVKEALAWGQKSLKKQSVEKGLVGKIKDIDRAEAMGIVNPEEAEEARQRAIKNHGAGSRLTQEQTQAQKDKAAYATIESDKGWVNTVDGRVGRPSGMTIEDMQKHPDWSWENNSKPTEKQSSAAQFYTGSQMLMKEVEAIMDVTGYRWQDASNEFKTLVLSEEFNKPNDPSIWPKVIGLVAKNEMSDTEQRLYTLLTEFATNKVYQESGAAVTASEFARALMQVMPAFGDKPVAAILKGHSLSDKLMRYSQGAGSSALHATALATRQWDKTKEKRYEQYHKLRKYGAKATEASDAEFADMGLGGA